MNRDVVEADGTLALQVFLLDESEACVKGECGVETNLLVQIGMVDDQGDSAEGGFPVCREHMHDFIDYVLEKGKRVEVST